MLSKSKQVLSLQRNLLGCFVDMRFTDFSARSMISVKLYGLLNKTLNCAFSEAQVSDGVSGGEEVPAQVCDWSTRYQPTGNPCQHRCVCWGPFPGKPLWDHHLTWRTGQTGASPYHGLFKGRNGCMKHLEPFYSILKNKILYNITSDELIVAI